MQIVLMIMMTGIVMIMIGRVPNNISSYGENDYLGNYW